MDIRSICVYCGSSAGKRDVFAAAAESLGRELAARPEAKYDVDAARVYTLAELIDLAQQHNPETRVTWQEAKARAASLGIARAAFYPTLTAVALAATVRQAALLS